MKKMIIPGLLLTCSLLQASENREACIVELPLSSTSSLKVNLEEKDCFTQKSFRKLAKETFEEKGHDYNITVYKCLNCNGQLAYKVADTNSFTQWIDAGNKTDPTTANYILPFSFKTFSIEPVGPGNYKVLAQPLPTAVAGQKRKRDEAIDGKIDLELIEKKMRANQAIRSKAIEALRKKIDKE